MLGMEMMTIAENISWSAHIKDKYAEIKKLGHHGIPTFNMFEKICKD